MAAALLVPATADAATLYVTTGGTANPNCTQAQPCDLRYAIETRGQAGDEIVVADGTYSPPSTITISRRLDIHGDGALPYPKIGATAGNNTIQASGAGARLAYLELYRDEVFENALNVDANTTIENVYAHVSGVCAEAVGIRGASLVRNSTLMASGDDGAALLWLGVAGGATGNARNITAISSGRGTSSPGMHVSGGPGAPITVNVRNAILRGPAGQTDQTINGGSDAALSLTSSNVRGGFITGAFQDGGQNQFSSNPTFWSANDPHQLLASVTRNAGSSDALVGGTDVDGRPRVEEGKVDIGADEFPDLSPRPLPAGNLISNPGAEVGQGVGDATTTFAPPAWTITGPLSAVVFGASGGFPTQAEGSRIGGGAQFFAGGPSTPSSSATQTVDLSAQSQAIDEGRATATLGAMLGGWDVENDSATVSAIFRDGAGADVGNPLTIGPVLAVDRGGESAFAARESSLAVPRGARTAQVVISTTRTDGSYDDGYADNVSLTLAVATPPGGDPAPKDTVRPVLSRFGATRTRFAVVKAKRSARKRKPPPRGTTPRFTLSEAATVTVAVERPLAGRRSGKRCVAPTRRRRKPRCTRYRRAGTVSYRGRRGANRFAFGGRVRGRALAPGAYRLSATGKDAAGNVSAAKRLQITILRG